MKLLDSVNRFCKTMDIKATLDDDSDLVVGVAPTTETLANLKSRIMHTSYSNDINYDLTNIKQLVLIYNENIDEQLTKVMIVCTADGSNIVIKSSLLPTLV